MRTLRVLIVDDSEDDRMIMGHTLRKEGFEVLEAGDGAEGLRLAAEQQPDLVLLDRKLGPENGIELIGDFMGAGATKPIPVIIASSSVYGTIEEEARAAGAVAVVEKTAARNFPALIRKLLGAGD
jgi:CheY-like chemotaxis protein